MNEYEKMVLAAMMAGDKPYMWVWRQGEIKVGPVPGPGRTVLGFSSWDSIKNNAIANDDRRMALTARLVRAWEPVYLVSGMTQCSSPVMPDPGFVKACEAYRDGQ